MTRTLRIATWNLHEGLPGNVAHGEISRPVLNEVVDLVQRLDVDVVAFQEVDFGHGQRSELLRAIADTTQLRCQERYTLSESSFWPGMSTGVALASRYELSDVRRVRLANPGLRVRMGDRWISSHDKGLLSAQVDLDGRAVHVVTLHALPFHVFKRDASEPDFGKVWHQLAEALPGPCDEPVVVCGDFNTPNRDLVLSAAPVPLDRAIGDQPTYEEFAYDDILFSDHFQLNRAFLEPNFSDHVLCVAEMELKV